MENVSISLADLNWDNIPEVEPTRKERKEIAEAKASGFCNEKETDEIERILKSRN